MDTIAIRQALTPLVGLRLRRAGRAANMLWVQFGEMREVAAYRGGAKTVGGSDHQPGRARAPCETLHRVLGKRG